MHRNYWPFEMTSSSLSNQEREPSLEEICESERNLDRVFTILVINNYSQALDKLLDSYQFQLKHVNLIINELPSLAKSNDMRSEIMNKLIPHLNKNKIYPAANSILISLIDLATIMGHTKMKEKLNEFQKKKENDIQRANKFFKLVRKENSSGQLTDDCVCRII